MEGESSVLPNCKRVNSVPLFVLDYTLRHRPVPILPTKHSVQGSHQLHAGLCKLEDRCYLQYQ